MSPKKSLFVLFILMVILQLLVPMKMILDRELILRHGTEFKFKTAPIDPHDPFRGKYISLQFDESLVDLPSDREWLTGQTIFLYLNSDADGFAVVDSVTAHSPSGSQHYLRAEVSYSFSGRVRVNYPLDRFYMEESKAYDAELAYLDIQTDTTSTAYALVSIRNGESVLKDVLIDGVPIKEVARQRIDNRRTE
ncbi:MAG: GDYXXLXY domain-containing protein [Balneolaceae bacterium]|nr:GDYXXLXY domain-containing protein [Balneolaceae bacterium]MCH8547894.1 GDYXXLXY domain-containing protein [Balneolaceae bacterium]